MAEIFLLLAFKAFCFCPISLSSLYVRALQVDLKFSIIKFEVLALNLEFSHLLFLQHQCELLTRETAVNPCQL